MSKHNEAIPPITDPDSVELKLAQERVAREEAEIREAKGKHGDDSFSGRQHKSASSPKGDYADDNPRREAKSAPASNGCPFWWRTIRFLIVLFLAATTLFAAAFTGITIYRTYLAVPDEIEVPVIQGKDLREANALLNRMGLRVRIDEGRYSNKFPEQIVISQEPEPGKTVREEREVLAVVSLGPELIPVPDLKGKSLREVGIILANRKLALGKVKEVNKEGCQTNTIVAQKPQSGTKVKRGTPVNVELNRGVDVAKVAVPDWRGKNIAKAQALLDKVGLRMGRISWSPSDSVQQGFVIQQNPPYGSEVAAGSEVELEVSAGAVSQRMLVQRHINLDLPAGSYDHDVRIMLVSGAGEQEAYHSKHLVGDKLDTWVSGPAGSDIEIYINGNLASRDRL